MDHYQTLGVLQSAEEIVIKAAFRALASVYHPDKNNNPDAATKMQAINEAYAVLSDPKKRSAYDSTLAFSEAVINASDLDSRKPFDEDPLSENWEIATRFNPEINAQFQHLDRLSWQLGFSFKVQLLSTQDFKNSLKIAQDLRLQYLSKYFGNAPDILNYAEEYILAKQINAALYLNKVIVVLGKSISLAQLKDEMTMKFPESVKTINELRLLRLIEVSYFNDAEASELFISNGGKVKFKFWGKVETTINNVTLVHNDRSEFSKYVLKLFQKKYS